MRPVKRLRWRSLMQTPLIGARGCRGSHRDAVRSRTSGLISVRLLEAGRRVRTCAVAIRPLIGAPCFFAMELLPARRHATRWWRDSGAPAELANLEIALPRFLAVAIGNHPRRTVIGCSLEFQKQRIRLTFNNEVVQRSQSLAAELREDIFARYIQIKSAPRCTAQRCLPHQAQSAPALPRTWWPARRWHRRRGLL